MRKRVPRLVVGSTHTLLKPVTVYTVVELRRVPNRRGTTSTTPVWRGACRDCGAEFDYPRVIAPSVRTCGQCRGVITGYTEIPPDVSVTQINKVARRERADREAYAPGASVAVQMVHAGHSVTSTKPLFTDR